MLVVHGAVVGAEDVSGPFEWEGVECHDRLLFSGWKSGARSVENDRMQEGRYAILHPRRNVAHSAHTV